MASQTRIASTIVLDAGPNTVAGPIDIKGIVVPTGTTLTVANATGTIETLAAGVYDNWQIRSSSALIFTGACTLHLRVC